MLGADVSLRNSLDQFRHYQCEVGFLEIISLNKRILEWIH